MFSAALLWGLRQESQKKGSTLARRAAARLGIPPEGEGAAVRLGVPPEGGGSCRRLVALRARRFFLCRYLGRLRRGQGAKGGAAPPLRPPTPPITPRFPRAAPPCSARLGRAACATAPRMPGATTAGPTAPIFCRVPCPASFVPSQVLRAFAVSVCFMLVGRQCNCVRRGWGVPLRDHTPLCRAQLPGENHSGMRAGKDMGQ